MKDTKELLMTEGFVEGSLFELEVVLRSDIDLVWAMSNNQTFPGYIQLVFF